MKNRKVFAVFRTYLLVIALTMLRLMMMILHRYNELTEFVILS